MYSNGTRQPFTIHKEFKKKKDIYYPITMFMGILNIATVPVQQENLTENASLC